MYTPHSVTVYNICRDGTVCIAFLDGVFLNASSGGGVMKYGAVSEDAAALFIPLDCRAVDPAGGQEQSFCEPGAFDRLDNRGAFWTIVIRDRRSCADCFFVRGKVVAPELSFAEIRDRYADVFRVSSAAVRDFGSERMRHWQIGGK